MIDYERLQALFGTDSYDQLRTTHKGWVEEQLPGAGKKRQNEWTGSIAVGSKGFNTMNRLHEKGLITNPVSKAKSVGLTEEGFKKSESLFKKFFKENSNER